MIVQWPRDTGDFYTVLDQTWTSYTILADDRGSLMSVPIWECEVILHDPPPYDASI